MLERVRCTSEPINKALSDFLNLGICHLDSMSVPYFNGLGLSRNLIRHLLALVDVGNGIVQGVLQEIDTVITAELTLYGIKTNNLRKTLFSKFFSIFAVSFVKQSYIYGRAYRKIANIKIKKLWISLKTTKSYKNGW